MAKEKVEPPPVEPELAMEGLKTGTVDFIYLLYKIIGHDKAQRVLYLHPKGDEPFKHTINVPDDVMKAVEIAAASDNLDIEFQWDNRNVIKNVVIVNYGPKSK